MLKHLSSNVFRMRIIREEVWSLHLLKQNVLVVVRIGCEMGDISHFLWKT